ncbi:hypothetical protein ABIE27_005791 [Paenibacillus sp. 4624]
MQSEDVYQFFQRRSCKQDRYSLVVQFSKIKLV